MPNRDSDRAIRLNRKELGILQSIAAGKTSQQIAEELCLSLPTIKWYRKRIKDKFEASSTIQMVRKAIDMGIL